jgi:hypothetical protein
VGEKKTQNWTQFSTAQKGFVNKLVKIFTKAKPFFYSLKKFKQNEQNLSLTLKGLKQLKFS